jgi:cobalamin biosynthesis Mg chelatase CobN
MVDQDIFGALKCAVARGQSLQQAMLSLYNAGYGKQDIEEAARALQSEPSSYSFQPQKQQPITSQNPVQQTAQKQLQQSQKPITSQNPNQMQKTANVQKVSGYDEKKKSKRSKFFIISLIVILVLLLGLLLVTLLFRDQISEILAGI